jgi:hypothetical protein
MHDIGLAAWFGGSLMGAVGVNGAASDVDDARQRARVANAGWARWTPWNLAAIGIHLAGAVQLTLANKSRIASQKGVLGNSIAKAGLTAAALGATAYSRAIGQKVISAGDVPVAGGTTPLPTTPPEVASAQKQLKALQWLIPALTGGIFVTSALEGEQQRPTEVATGTVKKLGQLAGASAISSVSEKVGDALKLKAAM